MIYTEITASAFVDAFHDMGRGNNFSYEGLRAMHDYFESIGCDYELDVIAICVEYTEYENLEEIKEQYDCIGSMDDLYDHTQVIEFSGGIIICDF